MGKYPLQEVKISDISASDTLIALMGPTGVGKSSFIDKAANLPAGAGVVGHTLASCTEAVKAYRVPGVSGRSVILVDTPGFDDTTRTDAQILKLIADWLKKSYQKELKLTGIIYLHRISDKRMAGTPLKNLQMFTKLCGDQALRRVVLATTMWDLVNVMDGSRRELELRNNYWKGMMNHGSQAVRFLHSYQSAWGIILSMQSEKAALLLQEEMVELRMHLSETEAGKALYAMLQQALARQKEMCRKLRDDANSHRDETTARALEEEYEDLQEKLRTTFEQVKEMKVPLGRRILAFFIRKKGGVASLDIPVV